MGIIMKPRLKLLLVLLFVACLPHILNVIRSAYAVSLAVWADHRLAPDDRTFLDETQRLSDFNRKLGEPERDEWLYTQFEPGQTFAQYVQCDPVRPEGRRQTVYVQPIGEFTEAQDRIIRLSAKFLGVYFCCPVGILETLSADLVPAEARRHNPLSDAEQFDAPHILHEILEPRLPDDALASIAFTATDLWPGDEWNYVFGLASIRHRVGVWSIARFGDPEASPEEYLSCLRNTLRTATHETGHMLSMFHCIENECNMCGCGSILEAERYPLYLCTECLAKLHWATRVDSARRLNSLARFCEKHELAAEQDYYRKAAARFSRDAR
jgi:archaemetzincin